jgi:hypothetical protein
MKAPLRMWTVYERPSDYPENYVARMFEVDGTGPRATDSIIIAKSLEQLREMLEFEMHLAVCIDRSPTDDPVVVEVWL